jgi:hypothetical protein
MMRMMLGVIAAVFLGGFLGLVLAGILGAVLGSVIGVVFFMLWGSVDDPAVHVAPDMEGVERVKDEALCIPRGQNAECVFLRDEETGEYLDIVECSMFPEPTEVDCQKRCLKMMNDCRRLTTAAAS